MHAAAAQIQKSPEKAEASSRPNIDKEGGSGERDYEDAHEEEQEKTPATAEEKTSETSSSSKRPAVKEEEKEDPSPDAPDDDDDAGAPPASKKAKSEGEGTSSSLLLEEASALDKPVTFPAKLMALLQQDDIPEGIYWLPSGDIFAMHTEKMDGVLIKHFQGTKFMSFTRTLNKWGFRKALGLSLPPKTVAYQHEAFLRDDPEKVKSIANHSKGSGKGRSKRSQAVSAEMTSSGAGGVATVVTGTPADGGVMTGSVGFVAGGPMQNPAQFNSMIMQQFGGGMPGFMGVPGSMHPQQQQQQQLQQPQDIRNQNMLFQTLMNQQQQHQNSQFVQQQMQGGMDPAAAQHQFAAQQFFFQQNPFFQQQQQQQMQLQQQQQHQHQQQGNALDTHLRTISSGQGNEECSSGGGGGGAGEQVSNEQHQNTEQTSGGDGQWDS